MLVRCVRSTNYKVSTTFSLEIIAYPHSAATVYSAFCVVPQLTAFADSKLPSQIRTYSIHYVTRCVACTMGLTGIDKLIRYTILLTLVSWIWQHVRCAYSLHSYIMRPNLDCSLLRRHVPQHLRRGRSIISQTARPGPPQKDRSFGQNRLQLPDRGAHH